MKNLSVKIAALMSKVDPEMVKSEFGSASALYKYLLSILAVSVDPVIELLWGMVANCDDDDLNSEITAAIYELSVRL